MSTSSSVPIQDENVKPKRTNGPGNKPTFKRPRTISLFDTPGDAESFQTLSTNRQVIPNSESTKPNEALPARTLRKRAPKYPKALLCKDNLSKLLELSGPALRVFLARARFANRNTGLTYPGLDLLLQTLGCPMSDKCGQCNASSVV